MILSVRSVQNEWDGGFSPELLRVPAETRRKLVEMGVGVGFQEKVLDPADIAIGADLLVPVSERVGRPGLLLLGRGQGEEADSL